MTRADALSATATENARLVFERTQKMSQQGILPADSNISRVWKLTEARLSATATRLRPLTQLRDLSPERLVAMMDEIRARAREIAATTGTTITFKTLAQAAPAVATPEVQTAIERAAALLGLGSSRLPSGAGHDAQMLARLGLMG